MKTTLLRCSIFLVAVLSATAATITADENGNGIGTVGGGVLAPDPGPGGLAAVLTYTLPFTTIVGDLLVFNESGDVIRFNGNTLLFYSDNLPTADSLADTTSPPLTFYTNQATGIEVGPEGNNSITYTPSAGQPGSVAGTSVTYVLISDGSAVPEPGSFLLLGGGISALILMSRRVRAM